MNKAHLTAISRKTLPVPTRWLMRQGRVMAHPSIRVLDYGCGKCMDVNPKEWDNYDPHFRPWSVWHKKSYNIIICNYVLCVVPRNERLVILKDIQSRLTKHGVAYISVRNDRPKNGWGKTSRGTYQGRVTKLSLPLLHECASFRTYLLTKDMELV